MIELSPAEPSYSFLEAQWALFAWWEGVVVETFIVGEKRRSMGDPRLDKPPLPRNDGTPSSEVINGKPGKIGSWPVLMAVDFQG